MQAAQGQTIEFYTQVVKEYNNITTAKSPQVDNLFSSSMDYEVFLMDTSFEENVAEDHVNAIWKASIHFLKNSVARKIDEEKGFNDENIFECDLEGKDEICDGIEVNELISKNSILSHDEKVQFVSGLKNDKDLKSLIQRLASLFCEEILEELVLIIYEIWEKYVTYKETTKLSEELEQFRAPSSTELDIDKPPKQYPEHYYILDTEKQIVLKADEAADEVSGCYYLSTKLRFINLREAQTFAEKSNQIRSQFQNFIEVIARAVYLCADGCFYHPNGENFSRLPTFNSENASFVEKFLDEEDLSNRFGHKRRNN